MGYKGERMRLFLTEQGYQKARENQDNGFIKDQKPRQSDCRQPPL